MAGFAAATLTPVVLITLAALVGGTWVWIALIYLTAFILLLDRLTEGAAPHAPRDAEFPAATPLLITLGLLHFALLALLFWSARPATGLDAGARVGVAFAIGLVWGQISHPVAHELIHARSRGQRLLGRVLYTTMLAGHHASAHLRVHHVHVGSPHDPNTPRRGEGFYRYALRATRESFLAGLAEETRAHRRRPLAHPYMLYIAGGVLLPITAWMVAGPLGAVTYLAVALHAQAQILLSDYVQHYGLQRQVLADGTLEPVGPHHAWNAPHRGSSALTLNATRHSHHHMDPRVPYPALGLDPDTMPTLPRPLPVMAAMALVPPLWRNEMDPRCAYWRHRDGHPSKSPYDIRGTFEPTGHAGKALAQSRHASRPSFSTFSSSHPGVGRNERHRV